MGLLRSFARFNEPQRVLVLPKRYRVPKLTLPGTETYQQGGVAQASQIGRSEEFVSLRDYRRGDPMRHIHWRSWARVGKPIVKEFEDEYFVRHGLVLDTFDDPEDEEPFEEAVSLAASYACDLQTQESLLDLMFVGVEAFRFTSGRGLAHTDQMLEILACAKLIRAGKFSQLANLVVANAATLTDCVLILLQWDTARRELVKQLAQTGIPLQVFVVQPAGTRAPLEVGDIPLSASQFRELRAGTIQEDLGGSR